MAHSRIQAWRKAVHRYDGEWQPQDWLLPLTGKHAYRLNPYNQMLDNSDLYGLQVCCCPLAVYTLGYRFGSAVLPEIEFRLVSGQRIAEFAAGSTCKVLYFILCDPVRPHHLRLLQLPLTTALTVLRGETLIADYFYLTEEYT